MAIPACEHAIITAKCSVVRWQAIPSVTGQRRRRVHGGGARWFADFKYRDAYGWEMDRWYSKSGNSSGMASPGENGRFREATGGKLKSCWVEDAVTFRRSLYGPDGQF